MPQDRNRPTDASEYRAWVRAWLDDDTLRDLPGGVLDPMSVAGAIGEYMPRSRRHYGKILYSLHDLEEQIDFTDDEVADWIVFHFERDGRLVVPIELPPSR